MNEPLITTNLKSELSQAKEESLNRITGPKDPRGKHEQNVRMGKTFEGSLTDSVRSSVVRENNNKLSGGMRRQASSVSLAYEKQRKPLETIKSLGLDIEKLDQEGPRKEMRDWCRGYYITHPLVSLCIDIYTRFPLQGMSLECKDPQLKEFYEQLFFDELEYEEFLLDFGREYWITGEVSSLANFNELLGVWDDEEIINPDSLEVAYSGFERDYTYKIDVPQYMKDIIESQSPTGEYQLIRENYPELIGHVRSNEKIPVSSTLMSRAVNKTSPWDVYGTPHLLRSFRQLMMEESLNAAQDAIADRLYAPFILAKLGTNDAGDGQPWIPTQDDLNAFNDDINSALAADFKLLTYHFGVDIKSVFGRESMPRFDNDYSRLERQQLQIWGIGESLISGSSNGAYASSALNRDLVTQLMSSWQKRIIKHYRRRAEVVAEAQGHYDYNISGGVRTPIYEEVLEVDEETGREKVVKKPKLLIPDLEFKALNLHDEQTERQFLQTLKNSGIPISDQTLSANIGIDFNEETEKSINEKVQKIVAEAEYKKRAREQLEARGLPIPEELEETPEVQEPGDLLGGGDEEGEDQENQDQSEPTPDITDEPEESLTTPPDTPNVAPVEENEQGDIETGEEQEGRQLPRNQTVPEESSEYRQETSSVYGFKEPSSLGSRSTVSPEEVESKLQRGYRTSGRGKTRREIKRTNPKDELKLRK